MSNRLRFAGPCLVLVAAALCGCHRAPTAGPVLSPPVVSAPPVLPTTSGPASTPEATPIKDALTGLLTKSGSSPFPKGTQLKSVSVKDGIATLDFSKEFNALANNGDTTESLAQKSLRAALANFPEVQKMRVTVEGKPFDSQNTDWTTPFPVRDDAKSAGGEGQGGGQ
ncbi:MAG: Sporulation and spore germination [Chthonomonadaceae bacterium]|nr:Sporulation and spore germination [Chthonomonadaceae bacterium]